MFRILIKERVWERDRHQCIFCHKNVPVECACCHEIRRSQGGMGIEQNIVTACPDCHRRYDSGYEYTRMYNYTEKYLRKFYVDLDIEKLKYNKWEELK